MLNAIDIKKILVQIIRTIGPIDHEQRDDKDGGRWRRERRQRQQIQTENVSFCNQISNKSQ